MKAALLALVLAASPAELSLVPVTSALVTALAAA